VRDLQAVSTLRFYTALKQSPCPPQNRSTQTFHIKSNHETNSNIARDLPTLLHIGFQAAQNRTRDADPCWVRGIFALLAGNQICVACFHERIKIRKGPFSPFHLLRNNHYYDRST